MQTAWCSLCVEVVTTRPGDRGGVDCVKLRMRFDQLCILVVNFKGMSHTSPSALLLITCLVESNPQTHKPTSLVESNPQTHKPTSSCDMTMFRVSAFRVVQGYVGFSIESLILMQVGGCSS